MSGRQAPPGLSRAPGAGVPHRLRALGAKRCGIGWWQRFGRFDLGLGRLPSRPLGVGEHGGLLEQGAHAVELGPRGRMQPAEATDAMKAGRQDVLEEAPDQFVGLQVDVLAAARGALPLPPPYASVGEQREIAVAGGGFEHVAAQIAQGGLAGTSRLAMHDPALLPNASGQGLEEVGRVAFEGLTKEGAIVIGQGMNVDKELGATGNPLALIEAQAAGGY